jgi:hypothetical protein
VSHDQKHKELKRDLEYAKTAVKKMENINLEGIINDLRSEG